MALDRFIRFDAAAPSPDSVERMLRNFVGEAGTVERKDHPILHHWVVTLPGKVSAALKGEEWHTPDDERERWLEVFLHPPDNFYDHVKVCVLTRQMDDFTHAIADGIVAVLQRYWKGVTEP